jgi:hypothetical protein
LDAEKSGKVAVPFSGFALSGMEMALQILGDGLNICSKMPLLIGKKRN